MFVTMDVTIFENKPVINHKMRWFWYMVGSFPALHSSDQSCFIKDLFVGSSWMFGLLCSRSWHLPDLLPFVEFLKKKIQLRSELSKFQSGFVLLKPLSTAAMVVRFSSILVEFILVRCCCFKYFNFGLGFELLCSKGLWHSVIGRSGHFVAVNLQWLCFRRGKWWVGGLVSVLTDSFMSQF